MYFPLYYTKKNPGFALGNVRNQYGQRNKTAGAKLILLQKATCKFGCCLSKSLGESCILRNVWWWHRRRHKTKDNDPFRCMSVCRPSATYNNCKGAG